MLQKYKVLLFLVPVAVILRVMFYHAYISCGGTGIEIDTGSYLYAAKNFVETGSFGATVRTPGYPFILAILIKIKGEEYYPLLVGVQIFLNIVGIVYLFLLCDKLFQNGKVAILAAVIATLNFLDMYYSMLVLSDSVAQAFIVIGSCYYVRFIYEMAEKNIKTANFVLGSASFIIAFLIRPAFMYLPAAFIIGFIAAGIFYKADWKKLLVRLAFFGIAYIMPVFLWSAYNKEHIGYDGYTPISNVNLYQYNAAVVYASA